jgi:DNA-directed RNA polymerase subunit L
MDFLVEQNGNLVPIEVKAEENVKANSLMTFLRNNPDITGCRYSMLPYRCQEQLLCMPLYVI